MGRVVDRLFGYIILGIFGLLAARIVLGLVSDWSPKSLVSSPARSSAP